jgi:hypothetical protein
MDGQSYTESIFFSCSLLAGFLIISYISLILAASKVLNYFLHIFVGENDEYAQSGVFHLTII